MEKTTIIETLKNSYNRDLRKQLVKTILSDEKIEKNPDYKIINQIFSYILGQLNWSISKNTEDWDTTPLDIMKAVFPKIDTTKWYQEQILTVKKMIDVQMNG